MLAKDLLDIQSGEEVLVVIDCRTPFHIGYVLRDAAVAVGGKATLMEIPKPPHGITMPALS